MASEPREVWGDLGTSAFVEASLLFRSLDDEARRDLLQIAQLRAFDAGEVISAESDDGFYLVRDGSCEVLVSEAGATVRVTLLERGAFFGEGRVLGGGRAASLVAASDATVVAFPAAVIAVMCERFPKVRKLLEAVHGAREKEAAGKLAS